MIESSLTREEAFALAVNQIPVVEMLNTTVHNLFDWHKAKGGCACVRARLWNGISLLLGYEQEGDEENGYIKGIWIRSY